MFKTLFMHVPTQDISDSTAKLGSLETSLRLAESQRQRTLESTDALEQRRLGLLHKCEEGEAELAAKTDQLEVSHEVSWFCLRVCTYLSGD